MTTGKTIALTRWNFVGKVMFLLLNMMSRFIITFLPRSKRLLMSWLQVTICSDFGAPPPPPHPPKINSVPVSFLSPSICHEVLHFHALEKEMATHSSALALRILGTGEPGGLPSMGSHRVRHDLSDLAILIFLLEQLKWEHLPSRTQRSQRLLGGSSRLDV